MILLEADFGQQEMRVMAHVSQCLRLLQIFWDGRDVHTEAAMAIMGLPREKAELDDNRRPMKRVNFGVIYGITEEGLYEDLLENEIEGWSKEDCKQLIEDWYILHPEVKEWRLETIAFARRKGYVVDMFGRRRFVPEMMCPIRKVQESGARMAANMPIQS
ncbi:hypothetical protein LCGC14_1949380, partial [marine sediment metagenome]